MSAITHNDTSSAKQQTRRQLSQIFALLCVTLLGFGAYYGSALLFGGTGPNDFAYFDKLAISFTQGRLHIITRGPFLDLTQVDGLWYVPFPPLPALLFIPWIEYFGMFRVDAILFSIVLGTANIFATFGMLQALSSQGHTQLNRGANLWLTLLFTLGTVHWYMSLQGSVWFVAQLATYLFMALAVWAAARTRSGLLAGVLMGIAMLGRPHVALIVPLLIGLAWRKLRQTSNPKSALARWLILCALPMFIAFGSLLAYNQARFDNPLDFGYTNAEVNPDLAAELDEFGQFNTHYLQRNLKALLWAPPIQNDDTGEWSPDLWGMSIFLTTPAFLFLFLSGKRNWVVLGAWTAVGLVLVPLLLYYNTGWWQFGYRFTLDFMPPLLVLLAIAAGHRLSAPFKLLIVLSILINAYGTIWFMGMIGRPLQSLG